MDDWYGGWWWVEGQLNNGQWMPLYNYREEIKARAAFKHIIMLEDEDIPRELEMYEDYRIRPDSNVEGIKRPAKGKIKKKLERVNA